MMAKRPEKRYVDYDRLIEALEVVGRGDPRRARPAKPEPLYALIDDEDDDGLPVLTDDAAGPLYALIDDDDAAELFTLGPPKNGSPEGSTASTHTAAIWADEDGPPSTRDSTSLADVDFSGLAGIEDDSPRIPAAPRRSGSLPAPDASAGVEQLEVVGPADPYGLEEPITANQELIIDPQPEPGIPLATLLLRFALLGLFAAIAVAAWTFLAPAYFPEYVPPPEAQIGDEVDPNKNKGAIKIPPWAEPADQVAASPTETPPPTETLSALGMAGVEEELAPRAEAPFVEVRRVDTLRDRDHVADLRRAFDTLGGTVDVADDGPFFEQDFRITGPNRVVRARPGFRPDRGARAPVARVGPGLNGRGRAGRETLAVPRRDGLRRPGADIGPKQTCPVPRARAPS